ncbi:GNAT family N-acetyltransferase [Candidatus Sumerlaeota bacterium]|nr:GNAT family N-acetyltransferase [Candidatus Sumerlaeota bacterium]
MMAAEKGKIMLRPATLEDAKLLFDWRNDSVTRDVSFSSEPIAWETHIPWLEKVLQNPSRKVYIGERMEDHIPIGQVRFDLHSEEEIEINIAVAPAWRGRGLGTTLIREGVDRIQRDFDGIRTIIALIKPDNAASRKAFQKNGFEYRETFIVRDKIPAEKWILEIN